MPMPPERLLLIIEDDAAFASLLKDLPVDEWEESFNSKTDSKPFGMYSL